MHVANLVDVDSTLDSGPDDASDKARLVSHVWGMSDDEAAPPDHFELLAAALQKRLNLLLNRIIYQKRDAGCRELDEAQRNAGIRDLLEEIKPSLC